MAFTQYIYIILAIIMRQYGANASMMVLLKRAGGPKGPPALFSELNNKKMGVNTSQMCLAVKWSLVTKISK